jgi:hypothetical protein
MKISRFQTAFLVTTALIFAVSVLELAYPAIACTTGKPLCHVSTLPFTGNTDFWRALALISLYAALRVSTGRGRTSGTQR